MDAEPADTDDSPGENDGRRRRRVLAEIPLLLVAAAVVAIIVKALLAQAFYIPSGSMEPQLNPGDRVMVSRLSYRLHDPRRGDVVVFDDPAPDSESDGGFVLTRWGRDALEAVGLVRPEDSDLIKRVIGLPGETVEGRDGAVFINGRPLIEPYLPATVVQADFGPTVVPEGHYFVMGDNRSGSSDSRVFGPVAEDSLVGRAVAIIWPPGRAAYL